MRAIVVKEFRELRRDRRTLTMLIGMPLLLLTVFGFAANFTVDRLDVAVVGTQAEQVAELLERQQLGVDLEVVTVDLGGSAQDAADLLRDDHADVAVLTDGARPTVYIDGSSLFAAQAATVVVARLGDAVDSEVLFNPDLDTSWVMIPALVGLILAFIGTIVTSIGLVKEREAGTMEQLAVMPFSSTAVVLGKIAPYLLLASLDMVIVTVGGMWVFGVPFVGNLGVFAVGALLFLFVVLGLGVLISTVSQTTGQAIQTALMMLLPQVLLSGMVFPLDSMAAGVRWIGYVLPLTWFITISQGVMLRGASWGSLWLPFVVLAVLAAVIFGAAVLRLRRSISPARAGAGAAGHGGELSGVH